MDNVAIHLGTSVATYCLEVARKSINQQKIYYKRTEQYVSELETALPSLNNNIVILVRE